MSVKLRIQLDMDITHTKVSETEHWEDQDKLLAYLVNQILMNKKAITIVDQCVKSDGVTLTSP